MKTPKTYFVYKHTAPNGKVYIGITSQKPEGRWGKDGHGYKSSGRFHFAIEKYGWENIKHEIVARGLSKEAAQTAERKLVKRYDSYNPKHGYNATPGGDKCAPMSEAGKEKIRQSKLGAKNPMYGKCMSDEHKAKISKANSGKRKSEATIERMREAQSNRSQEWLDHLREANTQIRGVRCVETGKVFRSVSDAAKEIKASASNIVAAIAGRKRHTVKGFHWEYV